VAKSNPPRTLQLRRRTDGSVSIVGELPESHDFSARWIDRYNGDLVKVTITVLTRSADGEITEIPYELVGFQAITDATGEPVLEDVEGELTVKRNYTGWQARRIEE
jgi:hypothetical protein